MAQVFISYRRVESSMLATLIAREFEHRGLTVFVDTRSIDGAGPFPDRLRQAIEDCTVFVCLLSATTLASEWVREEIAHAHQHQKILIPVFQERYVPPAPIPDAHVAALLQSDGIHVLDVKNLYVDEAIGRLVVMVKASIATGSTSKRRVGPKAAAALIIGIVVLAALLAVLVPPLFKPMPDTPPSPTEPVILPASDTPSVSETVIPTQPATRTPDPRVVEAIGHASVKMTTNADWQQIYPDGFVHTFDAVAMALVPAGCFNMGGNGEGGQQCFDAPFWIDRYEVSNEQFERLGGSAGRASGSQETLRPRDNITWFESRDYCETQRGARLPTEREWEYAARGPDALLYPWGSEFVAANTNAGGSREDETVNVDSLPAGKSWVGAEQLSGNVWEWMGSWFAPYPYNAPVQDDPADVSRDANMASRVLRGGAWFDPADVVSAIYRNLSFPDQYGANWGIRCARSLE